ncbi:MAG TPA: hypothetical protein VGI75_12585, partial [Pirellulales bacterium]
GGSDNTPGFSTCVVILASIIGSMVFLGDKEHDRFRYFVDHNIPPRYVWFTRQLLWLLVTFSIGFVVIAACGFWRHVGVTTLDGVRRDGPPPELVLEIATAYAAGQWMSMHVRSGVLSGFFGLLLSALLCGWIFLMHWAGVDLTWSALPIPLVLMYATWLRAPDWISENKRWSARIRAAAVMLVPMAALLVAVPIYRVQQIPARIGGDIGGKLSSANIKAELPGFDVDQFAAAIRENRKAGQKTADLYRQAVAEYEYPQKTLRLDGLLSADQGQWLAANEKALNLALEAGGQPHCYFGDPLTEMELPPALMHGGLLSDLLRTSGKQLEAEGDLDGALDRYFAALHATAQLSPVTPWPQTSRSLEADFAAIAAWGATENVTYERVHQAIDRLAGLNSDYLHTADNANITYLVARRSILAGKGNSCFPLYDLTADQMSEARRRLEREVIWGTLMPWENQRAVRLLNLLMYSLVQKSDLVQLFLSRQKLAEPGEGGPVWGLMIDKRYFQQADARRVTQGIRLPVNANSALNVFDGIANLIQKTSPDLQWVDDLSTFSIRALSEFEARRRGTIVVLAIEAYRLKHGMLPAFL